MVVRKASLFSLPSSFAATSGLATVRRALQGIRSKESIRLRKINEVEEYRQGENILYHVTMETTITHPRLLAPLAPQGWSIIS